jgi:site-specific DNA-methyltransferase (adenine-specific)
MNRLFYGDNLEILRKRIANESVDLIYLDPPFNSDATYNVLFKSPTGQSSPAQLEAFGDTWHWNKSAEDAFDEVMRGDNSDASEILRALRGFLKENDMMAYIAMMSIRLIEMQKVLKKTGSIYLHCDPTASHYLKLIMDAVFGKLNYRAEIIWRRTNARGTSGRWPRLHDTIFYYTNSDDYYFTPQKVKAELSKTPHTLITRSDGLKYQTYELTGAGQTKQGESGSPWRSFDPNKFGRHWGYSHAQLEDWNAAGLIHWPKDGGFPRRLDSVPFDPHGRQIVVGSVWTDIDRLNQASNERLGYPTQKPLALLERIVSASSKVGDTVLDPFCGCGTTVHAAEKLERNWIGIDITHLAVSLIRRRLIDAFPYSKFDVVGAPKDIGGARQLAENDKHQFQLWALSLIEAQPFKGGRKGADGGVDGYLYFKPDGKTTEKVVVSVKGGGNVGVGMIRDLIATVDRETAKVGVFLTLEDPTTRMRVEATAAGFYESPLHGKFPKIQIVTIEELLSGVRPHLPWIDSSVFRKARRENTTRQGDLDL